MVGLLLLAAPLAACGDGDGTPVAATSTAPAAEVELWCTRYERFTDAARLVDVDATAPDAPERLDALRGATGPAADDLAAATEEAEILVLDTPVPPALAEQLPALLASGEGALDPDALGAVEAHVTSSCQGDPGPVALLARLGGG